MTFSIIHFNRWSSFPNTVKRPSMSFMVENGETRCKSILVLKLNLMPWENHWLWLRL